MKRWCFWCESPTAKPEGWVWVHDKCINKLIDKSQDFDAIIRLINEGKNVEDIKRHLERMADFDRRWNNTIKIIEKKNDGLFGGDDHD